MLTPVIVLIEHHLELMPGAYSRTIVTFEYFETLSVPRDTTWLECLYQLSISLNESGLGACEPQESNDCLPQDYTAVLRNTDYGRPLLQRWVERFALIVEPPLRPFRWKEFQCESYFQGDWWHPRKYEALEVGDSAIYDKSGIYEDLQNDFLAIGSPGIDAISLAIDVTPMDCGPAILAKTNFDTWPIT